MDILVRPINEYKSTILQHGTRRDHPRLPQASPQLNMQLYKLLTLLAVLQPALSKSLLDFSAARNDNPSILGIRNHEAEGDSKPRENIDLYIKMGKDTTSPSPTATSAPSTVGTCSWEGHCEGISTFRVSLCVLIMLQTPPVQRMMTAPTISSVRMASAPRNAPGRVTAKVFQIARIRSLKHTDRCYRCWLYDGR